MRRSRVALMLAMIGGSTIIWTTGCAKATEPPAAGQVAYLAGGWYLPRAAEDVLKIPDEAGRLAEFERRSARLEGVFVVPKPTFAWLVKQAARTRRMEEQPAAAGDP